MAMSASVRLQGGVRCPEKSGATDGAPPPGSCRRCAVARFRSLPQHKAAEGSAGGHDSLGVGPMAGTFNLAALDIPTGNGVNASLALG